VQIQTTKYASHITKEYTRDFQKIDKN